MRLEITFLEPARLHANSKTITTADVAIFLEKKYNLVESFTKKIQPKLMERITKVAKRYIESQNVSLETLMNRQLGGWLQNEWREYVNKQEHGIKTKVAEAEKRRSFIDTGDYFKSMITQIRIK